MISITSNTTEKASTAVKLVAYILLICPVYVLLTTTAVVFSETQKIAIVPFAINAQKDISYIKDGIFQMLSSRLAWRDNLLVATEKEVDESLASSSALNAGRIRAEGIKSDTSLSDTRIGEQISKLAADTGSDYVIQGSITEFAGAFSVDATVFSISQKRSQSFFTQADTAEQIIPSVEILSAKINMDIFNRKTSALAMVDEDNSSNTRANPEKLMPQAPPGEGEKRRPFWKFWGKQRGEDDNALSANRPYSSNPDSAATELEQEEDIVINTETETEEQEEKRKPFWKFW